MAATLRVEYELHDAQGSALRIVEPDKPGVWAPLVKFAEGSGKPVRYPSEEGAALGQGIYGGQIVPVAVSPPTLNGGW